jgi:hypothetical protein
MNWKDALVEGKFEMWQMGHYSLLVPIFKNSENFPQGT